MAFRFRKSIKVLPGVRVNVGKRGLSSVSLGTRGARVTVGSRGTTTSVGIPGTGLSVRSRSTGAGSDSSGQGSGCGVLVGLLGLGLIASCVVCMSSGEDGSRPTQAVEAPASDHEEPEPSPEPGLAASAPDVVHAFGDGAACRALGACQVLEAVSDELGTTWRLAGVSDPSGARIELLVTPDASRISSVGVSGDSAGDLAALVLEDLEVPDDDRPALAWHVREHLGAGEVEGAKPLCGSGVCASAGSASSKPAVRLLLDPKIEADPRAMKRAARAARRAAKLEAHREAKQRAPARRRTKRTRGAQEAREEARSESSPAPRRSCCKHCSKGIPCGDTCIAANRTCHKGPGCAC